MNAPARIIARWPEMMVQSDAAEYCGLSVAAFEREVYSGRLPMPHRFGGRDHWRKSQIDAALDAITGDVAFGGDDAPYRRKTRERCCQVLDRYDLSAFLHTDWRTGDDPKNYRGNEVRAWLNEHGDPPYVILDDDTDFDEDQTSRLVISDSYDGFSLRNFEQADRLLAELGGAA